MKNSVSQKRYDFSFNAVILIVFLCVSVIFASATGKNTVSIPLGGNAYVTQKEGAAKLGKDGLYSWSSNDTKISSWFKVSHGGLLTVAIRARVKEGNSEIEVSLAGKSFPVTLNNSGWQVINVGAVQVKENQHVKIDFKGISKTGATFADVSHILIEGAAAQEPLVFVREPENFYFGRRGPSVHLSYLVPESTGNVEYFYNEVIVQENEDVIGSYYMVNGFGEGYCGIQVNSATERRILFSVWSPYSTDNPDEIPEEAEVHLLRKGKDVVTKEFGGEGSGGQSFLRYSWTTGTTYKFLTQIHPDENRKGATVYTSWFFDPQENNWRLIASFSRPKKVTWYTRPHSFLENFSPSQGYLTREVEFTNQWLVTESGEWLELNSAKFTYDATASAKRRADYDGGITKDKKAFVLRNCGFFDENTPYGTIFKRKGSLENHPDINMSELP